MIREEAEQQLCQMKLQHGEAQRRLLHQLHCERQRLQEQQSAWETQLHQLEQEKHREKLRCEERAEEQAGICSRLEEEHREEISELKEHIASLQEQVKLAQNVDEDSRVQNSQLEAKLVKFRVQCGHLEDELADCRARCCELERELDSLQAESDSILQDKEIVADNCSRLSNSFVQQQAQLRAKEQSVKVLREELENLQEAVRNKVECHSKLTEELYSLKADRAKLIQDLKDQAMAVDNLQLELDSVTEELDRWKSAEASLQDSLKQEQARNKQIQSILSQEREEVDRLSQENGYYIRVTDQLSTQIVEMEAEISTLRNNIHDLSSQLNETADLVLDLRKQLKTKTTDIDRLQAEVMDSTNILEQTNALSERHCAEVLHLTILLEAKERGLDSFREQADNHSNQLQLALLDTQAELQRVEQAFEWEKGKMTEQLMEMEKLVIALEMVMDPASPHRFVNCEVGL